MSGPRIVYAMPGWVLVLGFVLLFPLIMLMWLVKAIAWMFRARAR